MSLDSFVSAPKVFMNRLILLLFLVLPSIGFAQVPGNVQPAKPDTVKPKKGVTPVDTAEYWKDSLFNRPDPKILKEGAENRPARPRPKRRVFKIRYSDRIQYSALIDFPWTAAAGVPTTLTLQKKLTAWQDSILPSKIRGDTTLREHRASMWYRFGKIVIIDGTIETLVMAIEQDFFGHLARSREFKASGLSYQIGAPIPFFRPMGTMKYDKPVIESKASRQQIAHIAGAALESGSIATEELSIRWMQRKSLFYREALHLLRVQLAGISSVMTVSNSFGSTNSAAGDWLYYTNRNYGHTSNYYYTAGNLKRDYALAAFTNPLLYTSLYSVFYNYMIQGKDSMAIPAIKLGYGKYVLPWVRFGFTPLGPEWIPEITVTKHRQVLSFYGRIGSGVFTNSYGGGIKAYNLVRSTKISLNAHVAFWNQPYLFKNWGDQEVTNVGWGGAALVTGSFLVTKNSTHPMSVVIQAGYKTKGFMEGEIWNATPVIKVGLSFALDRDYVQDDTVPQYEEVPRRSSIKADKKKAEIAKKKLKAKYK